MYLTRWTCLLLKSYSRAVYAGLAVMLSSAWDTCRDGGKILNPPQYLLDSHEFPSEKWHYLYRMRRDPLEFLSWRKRRSRLPLSVCLSEVFAEGVTKQTLLSEFSERSKLSFRITKRNYIFIPVVVSIDIDMSWDSCIHPRQKVSITQQFNTHNGISIPQWV